MYPPECEYAVRLMRAGYRLSINIREHMEYDSKYPYPYRFVDISANRNEDISGGWKFLISPTTYTAILKKSFNGPRIVEW